MKRKLSLLLASDADRDDYYIELCENDIDWGTVEEIDNQLVVKIFPDPSGNPYVFSVNELQELLTQAVHRLQRAQEGEELSRLFPDADAGSDAASASGNTDE